MIEPHREKDALALSGGRTLRSRSAVIEPHKEKDALALSGGRTLRARSEGFSVFNSQIVKDYISTCMRFLIISASGVCRTPEGKRCSCFQWRKNPESKERMK